MSNLYNIDGNFYDEEYFERGRITGKSWYENYHWMPRRSFREAFAYIDYLQLDDSSCVLDFGCAKGFIVKALRELEINSCGCDISNYALSFAPSGCWNSSVDENWYDKKYTHVIVKDVFEHLRPEQLDDILNKLSEISSLIMCIVPMGDNGKYRISEYSLEQTHIIAENEDWWRNRFYQNGWHTIKETNHVEGLKDNWISHVGGLGNHIYVLEQK
jgi:cyclopropane fatty-acyl-phospholipid synthase-like methyltransferase